MDIREHAQAIRETLAELPDQDIYVMSLKCRDKGITAGLVAQVTRRQAAEGIVDATHRLATEDEIEAHVADQQAKGDAIRKADLESRFPLNLSVYTQMGKEATVERTPTSPHVSRTKAEPKS
jgi:hypothetical protein